jgi:replicative DNA helicase Mcm
MKEKNKMTNELETVDPQQRFQEFFKKEKYRQRIAQLAITGKGSITIDFEELYGFDQALAELLLNKPEEYLQHAGKGAYEQLRIEDAEYAEKIEKVVVRIVQLLGKEQLRKLGSRQMAKLVMVEGIIVRATPVRPMVLQAAFKCKRCGTMNHIEQTGQFLKAPVICQAPDCGRDGPFEFVQEESTFIDSQDLRLQEKPEDLPPGQLPRTLSVKLVGDDIVDVARPGDHISIVGIVRAFAPSLMGMGKLRTFILQLDANSVEVLGKEPETSPPTPEEEEKIHALSKDPWVHRKIIQSIAPSIFGYEHIKEAIMYLLFGGVSKSLPDINIRGEMNALLIGDPGTAKSQLLQYVARIAPRGLYTSGRGTTAAGLTAAVVREKGGSMTLEAGALVLADKGIACLHPSAKVFIDGKVKEIGKLIDDQSFASIIANGELNEVSKIVGKTVSFDEETSQMIQGNTAKLRRRLFKGKILKVQLRSGLITKVTPDHRFLDGNTLRWKEASGFAVGDYLVAPMKIPETNGCDLFLWDILPDTCVVSLDETEKGKLRELLNRKYGALINAANALGLDRIPNYYRQRLQPTLAELKIIVRNLGVEQEWRASLHLYDNSPIKTCRVTPELAYICGFIFGDGHVKISKRHAAITLTQSPKHKKYMDQFAKYWTQTFDNLRFRKVRTTTSIIRGIKVTNERIDWSASRRILGHIYQYITQEKLSALLSFPQEIICGFLSGLTDADGCITKKTCSANGQAYETWNVVFTASGDEETNRNLVLALRRLSCVGSFKGIRHKVGIVTVSGRSDCLRLQEALEKYSVKMHKIPSPRLTRASAISEKLPKEKVTRIFNDAFSEINRSELVKKGVWSTVYDYSHGNRQPAIGQVQRVLEKIKDIPNSESLQLQKLIQKDYFIDEIVNISEEDYGGYVYDLMMKNIHNYYSDGVISHNCIDEMDKMRPEDRVAIHEAMEQHTVSVAKGGIVATLNARTAILAAANPSLGRYEPNRTVAENISLPVTILSRFDLIFVLRDVPDKEADGKMSQHILEIHRRGASPVEAQVSPELLRKYVSYARGIKPVLSNEALKRLSDFYLAMRSASETEGSPVAITARQLESLVRISEARARVALRKEVTAEDAEAAIAIMKRSLEEVGIDLSSYKVDIDLIMTGRPKSIRDRMSIVLSTLMNMEKVTGIVEKDALVNELETKHQIPRGEIERMISQLLREGTIYEPREGCLKKT